MATFVPRKSDICIARILGRYKSPKYIRVFLWYSYGIRLKAISSNSFKSQKCIVALSVGSNVRHGVDYLHSGGRLNKKDGLTRYGDSHVKDKTS